MVSGRLRLSLLEKKMRYRTQLIVLASVFLLTDAAGLSAQGPPITTETAFVNGIQGAAVRSFVFLVNRSGLVSNGKDIADPSNQEVSVFAIPIIVPYEVVKNKLDIVGGIPVLHKRMAFTDEKGERRAVTNSGLGDLFVLGRYLVLQKDAPGKTTRMVVLGGVKSPTGKDDEKDSRGNKLPPPLQLGTGSVDYTAGVVATRVVGRIGLNADLIYNFNTAANDFAFGDKLKYDFALGYRISPREYKIYPAKQWNAYLELNGEFSRRDGLKGVTLRDSGGNVAFVSPGIQFYYSSFLVEASLRIPGIQNLNGTQLKFHPAFTTGFRWLIF